MKTQKIIFIIVITIFSIKLDAQFKLKSNGYVGIGTNSPQRLFVIGGSSTPLMGYKTTDGKGWATYASGGVDFAIYEYTNTGWTSGAQRLTIKRGGNIYLRGHAGVGSYVSSNYNFYVSGDAYATDNWQSSDKHIKKDIKNLEKSYYKELYKLNSYSYKLDKEGYSKSIKKDKSDAIAAEMTEEDNVLDSSFYERTRIGLLAQEVQEIYPELVKEDENGYLAINYNSFIPILINALKDQQEQLKNLKNELDEQKMLSELLLKNYPNPATNETKLNFTLPDNTKSASIYIYNPEGVLVKKIKIKDNKESEIVLNTEDFKNGVYTYTLVADNTVVGTKRLLISK
ncbi:T9SS type A sorting domain-containing protein [Bacteroidota bacterium]